MNKLNRIWYRAGRRGAVLLFLALLDILFGLSFLTTPLASPQPINYLLPYAAWGWIWIITGIFCATGIPAANDRIQFTAATTLKIGWGLTEEYVWWHQHIPRVWVGAVVWLGFGALVWLIGSWPESAAILAARHARKRGQ